MNLNGVNYAAFGSPDSMTDVVIKDGFATLQNEKQKKDLDKLSCYRTKCRSLTTLEKGLLFILCVLILAIVVIVAQKASIYSKPPPPQTNTSTTNLTNETSILPTTTPNGLETKQQLDTITAESERSNECTTKACVTTSASILSSMDLSADPCQDFYRYSCGRWSLRNQASKEVPITSPIRQLQPIVHLELKKSLENPQGKANDVSSEAERSAQRFYQSCLNFKASDKQPLLDLLEQIGGWPAIRGFSSNEKNNTSSFQKNLQLVHALGGDAFFEWSVQKPNTLEHRALTRDEPFILMEPSSSTTSQEMLNEVGRFLAQFPALFQSRMRKAIVLETQIKEIINFHAISKKQKEADKNSSSIEVLTIFNLQEELPFLNWFEYFNSLFSQVNISIPASQPVALSSLDLFRNLSSVISEVLESDDGEVTLQNYLAWNAIRPYILKYLLQSSILFELDSDDDKSWRPCVNTVTNEMGYAVAAAYVRQIIRDDISKPAETKQLAKSMLTSIKEAFKRNLNSLNWMEDGTRDAVKKKIELMSDIVGYPDFILNPVELDDFYGGLVIKADDYINNKVRVKQFMFRKEMAVLKQSRNAVKFFDQVKSPLFVTVNAMYVPSENQIILPISILQEPLFHVSLPAAINFGAMGSIMGHEVVHGFDNTKQKINQSSGKLRNWWNNATVSRFQERAACLVEQYSNYNISGRSIDGKWTLSENIADNGGVKTAFNAFNEWRHSRKEDNVLLPGLNVTQNQLFFLSYAHTWCNTSKKELLNFLQKVELLLDPHSPGYYRVVGPLSNMREFSSAFQCKPGTQMNPIKKCEVW